MKYIKSSDENEMIAVFLAAEINSKRFWNKVIEALRKYNVSNDIILWPDLNDKEENEIRKSILNEYRGYADRKGLFENFPKKIKRERISLSPQDLQKIQYINYDYWLKLSNGTRLAADAAKTIQQWIKIFDQSNDGFLEAAAALSNHLEFAPMILVATQKKWRIVVVEGHLRLTSYALNPNFIPQNLIALVWFSQEFTQRNLY